MTLREVGTAAPIVDLIFNDPTPRLIMTAAFSQNDEYVYTGIFDNGPFLLTWQMSDSP